MARMTPDEWRKKKEEEKKQGTTSSVSTPSGSSNTTTSGVSSGRMTPSEWREKKASTSLEWWAKSSTSLLNEMQRNSQDWSYAEKQDTYSSRISNLLSQADSWRKQYAGNSEAISYIDSVVDALSSSKQQNWRIGSYYSKWDSEEDYFKTSAETRADRLKKYSDNQTRMQELQKELDNWNTDFDRRAEINKELSALRAENRQYERGENGWVSKKMDEYYGHTSADDFQTGSMNRDFTNPTREDLDYYDVMMDNTQWYTDAHGNTYDAFGNKIDMKNVDKNDRIVHPMANDERFAVNDRLGMYLNATDDEVSEAVGMVDTAEGSWAKVLADGEYYHWDNLTSTEIDIYYYLLNTQGTESADKFLDDMEVELAKRETMEYNQKWAEDYESADALGKIFMNAVSVPANVIGGGLGYLDDLGNQIKGEEINPYNIAHSGMHYTNTVRGLTAADLDETGFEIPLIDFSLGDIYQTGMSRLDSALATGIGGGAGTILLGMGAAQNEGYRLYQAGASAEQITWGALTAGAAEAVFEYVSFDKLIKLKDAKTIGQWVTNALIQGGIEASEEGFTEIANTITNAVIMGQQSDVAKLHESNGGDWMKTGLSLVQQTAQAMFGGFLGGFGAGATQGGKTYINTQAQYIEDGRTITGADGGVDALKALANEVAGVSSADVQKNLADQVGKVEKKATSRRVGKLYDTVQTANNLSNASANQADIAKSLQRKGFNSETANDIAEALVASYNGQELTTAQSKLLESAKDSKVVQDAISNIVTNEQSTMGQRSQNIRDFQRDIYRGVVSKAMNEAIVKNTTEKQFTPSGDYAVSKDGKATVMVTEEVEGKTITKDTGEVININGIASIRKGEMLLDIGDGKTINAKNVAYANENDALIYESIANLGDNINPETANKLIGKYKGGNALVFARGIAQAYTYGFYGIDRSEMTGKHALTTELTEEQRNFAYGLGEQYRPIKDAIDKTNASKNLAKSGKTPSEKGVYYRDKDGNATDISTYLKESNIKLNDLQKTGIEAMRKMSKMMGVRFNVFETWVENGKSYYLDENGEVTEGNPNGFYDTTTGEIYIDLNAGNDYQGTMLFTIAHEVTHFMRQWSPEHFTKIAKIVFQHGGMKGNVSELVALKQAKAKAKGKPISYDVAMEEVVADGMETILKDGKVVEFMADVKKKDYAAWEKLKGWFKNLAKFLRKLVWAYRSQSAQTTEGAKVAEFSQDLLNQIERIFAEGAVASGENYSRVESIVGQINISLDDIMALDTVYTIDSSNATPYTGIRKDDEISGKNVLKGQGGFAVRPGFGKVTLGRKSAVNTVFHGNGPAKQAAFPAVKAVIENGIEICRDINHKGRGYDTVTFAAPIDFFQTKAPLGVVVQVFDNGRGDKSFYIHEICDAEGNYIELVDGVPTKKEISNTGEVEPTSTADVADDGNNPNTNIHNDSEIVKSESAEALDVEVDTKTESAAPTVLKSERTWTESDYVQERETAAKEIAKAIGVSVKKAKAYIDSVNSIAKMIAEDRVRLDYFSSPGRSSFVGNVEYGGSFDFSTLCKKRRLLTGTFTAIQKALPNTALTANEILDIRNRMKKAGIEVSCGLCYVEGSRANMGQFAKEFLKLYKQYYPDAWQPNMADVNTPDGIEWVRINHPESYEQYEYFWNHYGTLKPGDKNLFASQQKPKLYQLHTEYKGEVLEKFNDDDNVEEKNLNGGIRLQSFSDFEIVHLIDTMQIIMDMSRVGLAGQAYTKVPDFAWALGDTGLKINLSLIAKGVDENGKLIFDDVEGMPIETAVALRNRYSKNVGTILVAFNDEQLLAAMADDRVDFIIPFHRSQWKKSQYEAMCLPAKTKDYTYMQNEKFIKPQYHEYRGRMVKDKATNYMPNEYWDFSKSGKENADAYLEMCARNNKRPKFYKLLQNNGDGSYSLKADGSTDGYWKLLIDFKMYDNDGNGSPQMPVKPDFNMDEATRMLNDYSGGHSNFPVAQSVVDDFVQEYKDSHKGVKYSDRDNAPTFYSQMAKVVDGVKQEKLGAASVVNMLRGKGVKAEEIKWSGIETWLEGKKSVTKAELQEFIAGSMLQIEEEVLDNKDRPYTEDQKKRLGEYKAKQDEVTNRVADEWKKITGKDLPISIHNAATESGVVNAIIYANKEHKDASFEGRLLKKLNKDLREVIENNDYFGFDSVDDVRRSIYRHRRDFIKNYEMSTNDKAVIVKYCNALNAYNELPNMISDEDTDRLRAIAREGDQYSRKMYEVMREHDKEQEKYTTNWDQYKLKGGKNYREMLFRIPGSTYSNEAMFTHWKERKGVLAHARVQDMDTFIGKMLFIEEIQSDWHNEGHKSGYESEISSDERTEFNELEKVIDTLSEQHSSLHDEKQSLDFDYFKGEKMSADEYFDKSAVLISKLEKITAKLNRSINKREKLYSKIKNVAPDAPFKDTYHEYVLKRLLREAAEQGYDSIGWTTAETQDERWQNNLPHKEGTGKSGFLKGYTVEYDQDIPKFLSKLGKKWGTNVGKTVLDNGTEVWSMAITDSMKDSVLTEGQALYQDRTDDSVSNRSLLANAFEGVAQNEIERNKIQEYKEKISLVNAEEQKLNELNEQIKELSFAKGPRDTKKIRDLQFEARQTANRINTYDKQLLRLEASKPLQDVLQREKKMAYQRAEQKGKEALAAYRERATKTQRELLEKWQESRKKGIDSRHRTAMRHKIKDVVNELNQYLLRGTKDRHVPIELQKAVAEALDAVNMDTVGAEERIAKLQDELLKAKTPEQIQEISRKIDHIQEMGDKMNGRLQKLKDAYDQFVNSDDPLIANSHDEVISNKLQSVIDSIGNTPLRDMTLAQLEDVYDMYRMVLTTVRNANKAFKAKKNESISTIANQVMVEVEKVGGKKKQSLAMLNGIKSFGWNNLKPVYAFEHIGSDHFTEVFNNVRAGEDVWAVDVTEAREFYLDKSKKYNYDSWDFKKRYKFTSASGMSFELDLEQIMSLYAYSKRDQAADHLKKGGIVIDETTEITVKNKLGIPVKFNPTEATAYNISDETLADIISKLSDEQKSFADDMQDYLSTVMGAKGNEVSLEMYGIKLFKEKFYFPLKSAHQFMAKAKEQQQGEVKIKNSGFSKETVQKASNPIVLTPFMNVWANHVNEMSMYHAFVLPMEDFYRVYNYKTPTSDTMPTESVEMFIQNAYGKGATRYIDQLLKDLNGGARTDTTTGIINKMMGLFKKGAVFASLSVVVQQPSAIARAAALVDTKYFIGPKVDHKRHKALWNEVKQYAPVAIIKEMGYFDTNMGKSTQDFILGKEYDGFSEKMKALVTDSNYRDEILSKAPALADEVAWCSIWEAVKREQKAKNPGLDIKSEAFLKLVGERFTEVIVKTQVYDSVLSRSGLMRSKDTGMKMATAFMAEPTTSINMVADALLQGKRGNRKYARAAIGAVIASQVLNSIMVSFVYAGRDDDEDETYLEKYIGTLTGEILDSLNPAGYIPFIKDIMSIVQGYDVERSDMAVISDLWKAWENLSKDNVSVYRKVEGFAGSIAQIFGLPVKNIMRDARGIYQTVMSFVDGEHTTAAGIGHAVKGAITGQDVSNQQQLYEAYLSGDKAQIARVKGRFKDQNAINNAIRKALSENDPRIHKAAVAWNANDLDEYMRIAKEIIAEKHFVQDDVVMAIRAEANTLAPDAESETKSKAKGMFTAEKFAEAIAQGDEAMANAIKVDIIQTAEKNGKAEEDAEKSFVSSATAACKELFLTGDISESQAVSALETYCDKTEDEAMADVQYWAFKQDYPDVYADDQWFDTYYEKIADSGLDIEVYMEYRNTVSTITGEGKKERRMAVIDSLPITRSQKDALYYAEGWTASKLYEAPWH